MIIIIELVYYDKIIGATWKFIQNAYFLFWKVRNFIKMNQVFTSLKLNIAS